MFSRESAVFSRRIFSLPFFDETFNAVISVFAPVGEKENFRVLKEGGFKNGGLNFDAKTRRQSNTLEDILLAYIAGMDAFALGLRKAVKLIEDGRIDAFKDERYRSYKEGIGQKIMQKSTNFDELSKYALEHDEINVESGRQEYLESVLNSILFEK